MRDASRILAIALLAIGAVTGEVALVSAHAARGAAAQDLGVNEQGFIQFALAGARPRPGVAPRLTAQQKSTVASILRDSRKVAHDARRLAQQMAGLRLSAASIASIENAAAVVDRAAIRQDFGRLRANLGVLNDALGAQSAGLRQVPSLSNARNSMFVLLSAIIQKFDEAAGRVQKTLGH